MIIKKYIFLILCCLPVFVYAKDDALTKENLRGMRYCEVILSDGWMKFAVYNTMGLNDCPEEKWRELTKENIKKETGSLVVLLNGPRYWTMDKILYTPLLKQEVKSFKGLEMKKLAHVKLGISDLMGRSDAYHPHMVKRDTVFVFEKGKPVYELVSPNGEVYVMQSYSAAKEDLAMKDLPNLEKKLKMPKGWQYKTGVLKKTEQLVTENDKAYVLQDNLMNSYQLATHDFLS